MAEAPFNFSTRATVSKSWNTATYSSRSPRQFYWMQLSLNKSERAKAELSKKGIGKGGA